MTAAARLLARPAFWLFLGLAAATAFVTLSPIALRPQTGHPAAERGALFLLLGASLVLASPRRWPWALVVVCLFAAGLEAAQHLVPGRHGRIEDALEKMTGAALGVALGLCVDFGWRRAARGRAKLAP